MNYTDLFLMQFFTTLGSISAGILSLTIVVPVATYYRNVFNN